VSAKSGGRQHLAAQKRGRFVILDHQQSDRFRHDAPGGCATAAGGFADGQALELNRSAQYIRTGGAACRLTGEAA
jgi:hypothetical protein